MTYLFGMYSFNPASLELTRSGLPVRLEPQPARALGRLLVSAGEVVTREELRAAIWGDHTFVDYDRGLAYCLSQVRLALGDSSDNPRFVQTLPKRGFRFLAPVAVLGVPPQVDVATLPAAPAAPGAAVSTRRSWIVLSLAAALTAGILIGWAATRDAAPRPATVAVSIFDNETGDPQFDGFVTGLSDLVVSRLAEIAPGRVGVIGNAEQLRQPRNIRNLKAIAATVAADYVIIGQLQRQDAGLRFIVHFIQLDASVHLSARRLLRPTLDVTGLGDEVVAEAERAVRAYVPVVKASSQRAATR